MGAVLGKFRKTKTTTEQLEGLEQQIQQIEKYSLNTQECKKLFVGNFLAISIGVYVLAFIIFYFVYFPPTWKERVIYSVPLLLFPLVYVLLYWNLIYILLRAVNKTITTFYCSIIFLRKLFTWYFQRKLNKNSKKLEVLQAEKKKILEQVMDKETYKVAVNLLARFGDKTNGSKTSYATVPRLTTVSATPPPTPSSHSPRVMYSTNNVAQLSSSLPPNLNTLTATPRSIVTHDGSALTSPLALSHRDRPGQELRRRTPFPIVNQQQKGVFERIVDVLIGDGLQDRFAMICKECYFHNGMALKEEFDYATFRCAFCNALNPSRKSRPVAPRLPNLKLSMIGTSKHNSGSSSTTTDSSNSENELNEQPQIPIIKLSDTAITTGTAGYNLKNDDVTTNKLNEGIESLNVEPFIPDDLFISKDNTLSSNEDKEKY